MSESEIILLSGSIQDIGVFCDSPLMVQVRIWSTAVVTVLSMNVTAAEISLVKFVKRNFLDLNQIPNNLNTNVDEICSC